MAKKKNPLVFMDMCIDGDPKERMVFEVSCFKFQPCRTDEEIPVRQVLLLHFY